MSHVSGIMLICDEPLSDEDLAELVNSFLPEQFRGALRPLHQHFGGNKGPQLTAFGAGISWIDEDGFAASVLAHHWESPENVVLVIQPEEGPTRVFRPEPRPIGQLLDPMDIPDVYRK